MADTGSACVCSVSQSELGGRTEDCERAAGAPLYGAILTVVYGDRIVAVDPDAPPEVRRQQRAEALRLIAQAVGARVTAAASAQSGDPS